MSSTQAWLALFVPVVVGALWWAAARTWTRPEAAAPKRFFVRYYEPSEPATD